MSDNSQPVNNFRCPFRATLITRNYGCEHASEITRREGPDIGCGSEELNTLCTDCFSELKNCALPALGYSDDLTSTPASVLQKIQYGGLLGLQSQVLDQEPSESVDNIAQLMRAALEKYHSLANFPYDQCLDAINNYKMKRRRGR